jgi:hypothetical protein
MNIDKAIARLNELKDRNETHIIFLIWDREDVEANTGKDIPLDEWNPDYIEDHLDMSNINDQIDEILNEDD